ncbi:hypothetical protein VTN02DRAFT_5410 [Thermoascus thermophilus]
MAVDDCKMATKSVLAAKVADINRLLNHQFTKEELNEKLRKQGAFDSKTLIFKRIELEKQLQRAVASGDADEIAKIEAQMAEIRAPKLAFGTSLHKPRSEALDQQQRLAEINLRNQKLNAENVRRAQIEERKANRRIAAAVARGEAVADPFARVKTRARTHYDVSGGNNPLAPRKDDLFEGSDRSQSGTPATASGTGTGTGTDAAAPAETRQRSGTPSNPPKKPATKGGVAVIRHRTMDDENIAALDLDIEIDI